MADPISVDADVIDVTATETRQHNLALAIVPWALLALAIATGVYFYFATVNEKNKLAEVKKAAETSEMALKETIASQEGKINNLTRVVAEKTAVSPPPPTIPAGMSLMDNDEVKRLVDCCADKAQQSKPKVVATKKSKPKKSLAKKSGTAFVPAGSSAKSSLSPATVFPPAATHGDCFQLTLPQGQ